MNPTDPIDAADTVDAEVGALASDAARVPRVIGVLGGSFDPPHVGHVALAQYALDALARDEAKVQGPTPSPGDIRVWILPAGRHPFGKAATPADVRLEMCRLAISGLDKRIELRDSEIAWSRKNPKTPTYTVDTLKRLATANPNTTLRLILGGDLANEVHKWRDWDRIKTLAPPLWIPRAGFSVEETADEAARPQFQPLPDVASSEIRERLGKGDDVAGLVVPGVLRFIQANALYGAGVPSD